MSRNLNPRLAAVTLALVALVALAPVPAEATCNDCYWAHYDVDKGNQYAATAQAEDDGCSYPWGGGEDVIAFTMAQAEADGEDAADELLSAYQTCNHAAASSGLTAATDARDHAADAADLCDTSACAGNDACFYVDLALSWYEDAAAQSVACWVQTR